MISGSWDKSALQWDLQAGKEIEEARNFCERGIWAVAVSRDGRWAITGGGGLGHGELKAIEVETGIVKQFEGHSRGISSIDISADSKFLASGSWDRTTRIWNLGTGKLVAGPFESIDWAGAVRFSPDSEKLAVKSEAGKCLEVWDVHTETLDVRAGELGDTSFTSAPVFWTNKNKTIVAAFTFTLDDATTIYEFDALTLETVGAPFEAHTKTVRGLALSLDSALLASAADDNTIKVWAFESRQLLASVKARIPETLILSPDSSQLAYTTGRNIFIYNIPLDILASIGRALEARGGVRNHYIYYHLCTNISLQASADKNSRINRLLNVRISYCFFFHLHNSYTTIISLMLPVLLLQSAATKRHRLSYHSPTRHTDPCLKYAQSSPVYYITSAKSFVFLLVQSPSLLFGKIRLAIH